MLDYVLLLDIVEAVRQMMRERSVTVVGYNTFRAMLRRRNRHRSSYESPILVQKRDKTGMDVPINEVEEFIELYEPLFLSELPRAMREKNRRLSSEEIAKSLFDEHQEEVWAQRKAVELAEEEEYPDYFLLDRDVIHPAARQMAEAAGQTVRPQNMDEARHDYNDALRFGIGTEYAIERVIAESKRFGPGGIGGLMAEVVDKFFATGREDTKLLDWSRNSLRDGTSKAQNLAIYFERGMALTRFGKTIEFWVEVKTWKRQLHLEDFDFIQALLVTMVAARSGTDMSRIRMINAIAEVRELFDNFRGALMGEAHRLLDDVAEERLGSAKLTVPVFEDFAAFIDDPEAEREPQQVTVAQLLDEELEKAIVRATLCLDLVDNYNQILSDLVKRGGRAVAIMEEYLSQAAQDEEQQIVVVIVNARRALAEAGDDEARREPDGQPQMHGDADILAEMRQRVGEAMELVPERYHVFTSGGVSPLRRALKELETMRRRHPTDSEQLGLLAMVLVRLDKCEAHPEMLEYVRWMRHYAIGQVLHKKGDPLPFITPGLLRVIDDTNREVRSHNRSGTLRGSWRRRFRGGRWRS